MSTSSFTSAQATNDDASVEISPQANDPAHGSAEELRTCLNRLGLLTAVHLLNPQKKRCTADFILTVASILTIFMMVIFAPEAYYRSYYHSLMNHLQIFYVIISLALAIRLLLKQFAESILELCTIFLESVTYKGPEEPFSPETVFKNNSILGDCEISATLSEEDVRKACWVGCMHRDSGLFVSNSSGCVSVIRGRMTGQEEKRLNFSLKAFGSFLILMNSTIPGFVIFKVVLPYIVISIALAVAFLSLIIYHQTRRDVWVFTNMPGAKTCSKRGLKQLMTGYRMINVKDFGYVKMTRNLSTTRVQDYRGGAKQYGLLFGNETEDVHIFGNLTAREALFIASELHKQFAHLFRNENQGNTQPQACSFTYGSCDMTENI